MSALPSKADMCSAHGNVTDSQEWLRTRIRAAGGITCLRFCGNSQTPRSLHAARVSMFCDSSRNCRRRILPTLVFISGHAAAAPIELKSRRVLPSANSPTYFHVDLVIHSARYRVRENDYGGLVPCCRACGPHAHVPEPLRRLFTSYVDAGGDRRALAGRGTLFRCNQQVDGFPRPDGRSLDRLAHMDLAGYADLLHGRRICERHQLARRAAGWQVVRSLARKPVAPSRLANPPTSRGLGGDRCNRACARRAPGTDQLWLSGGVHTNMVPRGVYRHCPARADDGGRMGSIRNAFLLGPDSCRNRRRCHVLCRRLALARFR